MEWFRWQQNPWGQEILRGLSWDVVWLAIAAGVLFAVLHALLYFWRWQPRTSPNEGETETIDLESGPTRVPERVPRHSLASRLVHWVTATSVLALLFTGFLPILGFKFSWVTPHWIAGLTLTAVILFHVIHASFWKGLGLMWISYQDLRDGWLTLKQIVRLSEPTPGKPGKNPFENKLFHHVTSIVTLGGIVTGVLMMAKVDTPFWTRDPYLLADTTWGVIYVVHGAVSVAFITLIMVHFYFAVRPEKRWLTFSMIVGWIPRYRYVNHYDLQRWPVTRLPDPEPTSNHKDS
ncbi:MAG: cytochrome b/b6 domain-containing protein [Candidatus Binatia bacterium]